MIDTPVTAKFFRKLELYLELRRQNKRVRKSESERGKKIWSMEKAFLLWAIKGHWHMGTPLDFEYVRDMLNKVGFSGDWTKYANQVMQNLVFKKFACYYPEDSQSIQITDQGFLMAETIEEADSKLEYIYILFMFFVWIAVIWGFLEVINKAMGVLKNIISMFA